MCMRTIDFAAVNLASRAGALRPFSERRIPEVLSPDTHTFGLSGG